MLRSLTILTTIALAPGTALAGSANSFSRSGTVSAQAVEPVVLTHWGGYVLHFGKFTVGSAGTVTVSTSGSGSTSGGVTFVAGSSTSADRLIVDGEPFRQVSITTGPGTVTAGASSMAFTTTPLLPSGYIPFTGSGYFTVGGTLSVGAGQAPGSYSGTYPVTVAYN